MKMIEKAAEATAVPNSYAIGLSDAYALMDRNGVERSWALMELVMHAYAYGFLRGCSCERRKKKP